MSKIERIKQLNAFRKFLKTQETDFYDWDEPEPERFQKRRKLRKKIEKEIFNLIEQL